MPEAAPVIIAGWPAMDLRFLAISPPARCRLERCRLKRIGGTLAYQTNGTRE
jgi:hypothetical protein